MNTSPTYEKQATVPTSPSLAPRSQETSILRQISQETREDK